MIPSRILTPAIVAGALLLTACGGPKAGAGADETVDPAASQAPANESGREETAATLIEAITGDLSWSWESFRDRATVDADDPELPVMHHVFVVDGQVWAEGRTDPPIGEEAEPITAVIDPDTREFELHQTPGFGRAVVHDGVMWGFAEEDRTITTFTPEAGAADPVVVPEIDAVLDATRTSAPVDRFISLADGRLFLQVHRTMFELDPDKPGAIESSFDAGAIFADFADFEQFMASATGDSILYDWYGENQLFLRGPADDKSTAIAGARPQAEVLNSPDAAAWHRGSELIVLDPDTAATRKVALTGAPTEPPANAVRWEPGAVTHLGDDNNPALHIAGSPVGVIAAIAKRDEIVLVNMADGSKVAVGHLFGDVTNMRPLVVGEEVWLWSHNGQGIQILSLGPPLAEDDGPEIVGDSRPAGDTATDEELADDPDYRSGHQQGRWAAEADLDGGWPADNDPDNYDPNASPEFKAGYIDGYDAAYASGAGAREGEGGTSETPASPAECGPDESLMECYG